MHRLDRAHQITINASYMRTKLNALSRVSHITRTSPKGFMSHQPPDNSNSIRVSQNSLLRYHRLRLTRNQIPIENRPDRIRGKSSRSLTTLSLNVRHIFRSRVASPTSINQAGRRSRSRILDYTSIETRLKMMLVRPQVRLPESRRVLTGSVVSYAKHRAQ